MRDNRNTLEIQKYYTLTKILPPLSTTEPCWTPVSTHTCTTERSVYHCGYSVLILDTAFVHLTHNTLCGTQNYARPSTVGYELYYFLQCLLYA
jgi:hypothetical protein